MTVMHQKLSQGRRNKAIAVFLIGLAIALYVHF